MAKLWFKGQGEYKYSTKSSTRNDTFDKWEQQDATIITMMWNSMELHIVDIIKPFKNL